MSTINVNGHELTPAVYKSPTGKSTSLITHMNRVYDDTTPLSEILDGLNPLSKTKAVSNTLLSFSVDPTNLQSEGDYYKYTLTDDSIKSEYIYEVSANTNTLRYLSENGIRWVIAGDSNTGSIDIYFYSVPTEAITLNLIGYVSYFIQDITINEDDWLGTANVFSYTYLLEGLSQYRIGLIRIKPENMTVMLDTNFMVTLTEDNKATVYCSNKINLVGTLVFLENLYSDIPVSEPAVEPEDPTPEDPSEPTDYTKDSIYTESNTSILQYNTNASHIDYNGDSIIFGGYNIDGKGTMGYVKGAPDLPYKYDLYKLNQDEVLDSVVNAKFDTLDYTEDKLYSVSGGIAESIFTHLLSADTDTKSYLLIVSKTPINMSYPESLTAPYNYTIKNYMNMADKTIKNIENPIVITVAPNGRNRGTSQWRIVYDGSNYIYIIDGGATYSKTTTRIRKYDVSFNLIKEVSYTMNGTDINTINYLNIIPIYHNGLYLLASGQYDGSTANYSALCLYKISTDNLKIESTSIFNDSDVLFNYLYNGYTLNYADRSGNTYITNTVDNCFYAIGVSTKEYVGFAKIDLPKMKITLLKTKLSSIKDFFMSKSVTTYNFILPYYDGKYLYVYNNKKLFRFDTETGNPISCVSLSSDNVDASSRLLSYSDNQILMLTNKLYDVVDSVTSETVNKYCYSVVKLTR